MSQTISMPPRLRFAMMTKFWNIMRTALSASIFSTGIYISPLQPCEPITRKTRQSAIAK